MLSCHVMYDAMSRHVMSCHAMCSNIMLYHAMSCPYPPSCGMRIVAVPRMQTSRVVLSAGSTTLSTLLAANNTALQSPQLSHAWQQTGTPYLITHTASSPMSWLIPLCYSQACATGGDDNDMSGQQERLARICSYADDSLACIGPYGMKHQHPQHDITITHTAAHDVGFSRTRHCAVLHLP